jgi:hypothetical protein
MKTDSCSMYSYVYHKDILSLTQNRKARAACPKCGVGQTPLKKEVSSLWYLVPFFFGIFGGLIAWIVNNDRIWSSLGYYRSSGHIFLLVYYISYISACC